MSQAHSPSETARAFYTALESGQNGDDLRPLLTEDVVFVEHPNLVKPAGGTSRLDEILAGSRAGAALLAKQTYRVHSVIEHGDTAVVRATWTGEIGVERGPFRKGQVLTAHITQFVTTRHGRISAIETYDCYVPFK